jgi:hypothetical protein
VSAYNKNLCHSRKPALSDKRGVDLISDALPFRRLWYGEPNAIGYAKFYSHSHDSVIRVYDEAGNAIETHENRSHSQHSLYCPFWRGSVFCPDLTLSLTVNQISLPPKPPGRVEKK